MSTPEACARDQIDRQLQAAGWILQHRAERAARPKPARGRRGGRRKRDG